MFGWLVAGFLIFDKKKLNNLSENADLSTTKLAHPL